MVRRFRRRFELLLVLLVAALLLPSSEVHGQSCFGVPTRGSQWAFTGSFRFSQTASAYGPTITADVEGPLVLTGGYSRWNWENVDDSGNSLRGTIAYEILASDWSICPYSGSEYFWSSGSDYFWFTMEEVRWESSSWTIPFGIGVARSFEIGPETSLTPHAAPYFYYYRSESDLLFVSGGKSSQSDSGGEAGGTVGITLHIRPVAFDAFVQATTVDNSDTVFGIAFTVLVN